MIFSLIISLVVGLVIGHYMIPILTKVKFGQEIRQDGPEAHLKKRGTPTMGGILFFFTTSVGMLVGGKSDYGVWFLLLAAFAFGATGLLDDALKLVKKRSEGLTPKQKIFFQIITSVVLVFFATKVVGLGTSIWIPIFNSSIDLGILYYPLIVFIMVGTTNACNLTDGIDGLLSSVSLIVFSGYFIISYLLNYEVAMIFSLTMIGGLFAFLFYNFNPAKVFMGDTGSFFIGGAVVGITILTKTELLLLLLGMIYAIEALSDIIQVMVYKKTKKRVFKMAPIHHHFELLGYSEKGVVALFSLATLVFVVLGLVTLWYSDISFLVDLQGENYVQ